MVKTYLSSSDFSVVHFDYLTICDDDVPSVSELRTSIYRLHMITLLLSLITSRPNTKTKVKPITKNNNGSIIVSLSDACCLVVTK